jgi:hypothetical protein
MFADVVTSHMLTKCTKIRRQMLHAKNVLCCRSCRITITELTLNVRIDIYVEFFGAILSQ